ncbi:hypothetical protein EfmE980_1916 [Enterococcus faecium E980]|nr:hypothetical protein EfmE980_1916 [Enterococcus faecium E980]
MHKLDEKFEQQKVYFYTIIAFEFSYSIQKLCDGQVKE